MKKIDKTLQRINLIEYRVVNESSQQNYQIVVADTHEILNANEKSFKILHKRKVSFDPEGLYNLMIESEAEFFLKDVNDDDEGAFEYTETYIEENIDNILMKYSTLFETASNLVANISASLGRTPIITAPTYIRNN
ncbi:hypothetical protein PT167_06335 [Erysipelothrix rhusiopathiae]|nr:hypothetical protein [Erysipelothrix rhusiopathiae]